MIKHHSSAMSASTFIQKGLLMGNNNQDSINQPIVDNESCCSQASCCAPQSPLVHAQPKIGRNDPCPCDSGRKFKKCCG